MENLLSIKNLTVGLTPAGAGLKILEGINLDIAERTIVGLVGGSGSGKTTTGFSLLRLLPEAMEVLEGQIIFQEDNLLEYSERKMQKIRGHLISMVFQEPLHAFNPLFRIGFQIAEVVREHLQLSARDCNNRVIELLEQTGVPEPQRIAKSYPHQLSGGLRQRAMIAQAIAANPRLIIADEPTSNLDVTLQARMIDLFRHLRDKMGISMLLITHDLGMVEHLADYVVVIREGKIIEQGSTSAVVQRPQHEYTKLLMNAIRI